MSQYNHPDDTRTDKNYKPGPYGGKKEDDLSNPKANDAFSANDKASPKNKA